MLLNVSMELREQQSYGIGAFTGWKRTLGLWGGVSMRSSVVVMSSPNDVGVTAKQFLCIKWQKFRLSLRRSAESSC